MESTQITTLPESGKNITIRRYYLQPTYPNQQKSNRKFTLFNQLPPELQDMIWKFAENGCTQRAINMDWKPKKGNPVPSLLHACQASRNISLKQYQLIRHQRQGYLFFNPKADLLSFRDYQLICTYIKLWKDTRSTRRRSTGQPPCKVMDYETILKEVEHIQIKDRWTLDWTHFGGDYTFRNLKVVTVQCQWQKHTAHDVARWQNTWKEMWKGTQDMPRLTFSCKECWCCECARRGMAVHTCCTEIRI